ncbi:MAG: hypothetical protein HYZ29_22255 [Myxococcales bacterium]|nr:hypothetical protein [Myxococcales bacterium]
MSRAVRGKARGVVGSAVAVVVVALSVSSCGGGDSGLPEGKKSDAGSDAPTTTCVAGEFRCVGDALETCAADATKFQPVATCQSGLCDAPGKQCDNCKAGEGACEPAGNAYKACDSTGQKQETTSCVGSTLFCVDKAGTPSCVACKSASDCAPSTNECELSSCSADGTCGLSPVAKGAPCGATGAGGQCSGAGTCVYCTPGEKRCTGLIPETCDSKGQWSAAAACAGSDPLCLAGACVQCTAATDCTASANECVTAACTTNKCGYSPKAQGTPCLNSAGTCNGAGQCNVCQPGNKICNGNVPLLCGSNGQYAAQPACTGSTPECDPATGGCVQCTTLAQCPTSTNPCLSALCSSNVCGFAPKAPGTSCPGGTCSAAGACQACTPGTKICSGNSVLTCNAQGQYDPPAPCTGGTPVCLNGNCQAGAVCGNGAIEGTEQCDDGNATKCDGCEGCERRRWLNVPANAYLAVPGSAAKLPSNAESACYEAWVKTQPGLISHLYLGTCVNAGICNFTLQYRGDLSKLLFAVQNGGALLSASASVNPQDGLWHHLAGCRAVSGGSIALRLFWDGAVVATANGTTSQIGTPSTVYVGGVDYEQPGLGGAIDEIRISNTLRYTGTFTPARRHVTDTNTVALFHLDEGAGTTATDSSSNALTATLTGTSWALDTGYANAMCQ